MTREPFLRTRAGRVSLLAMLVVDVFILPVLLSADAIPMQLGDVVFAITMLVGAAYAFLYEMVNELVPGSLTMEGRKFTVADYPYFSFTTMTSVGFGDALPRTSVARALAMAQALTGQLYVAVLIARFVNANRSHRGAPP